MKKIQFVIMLAGFCSISFAQSSAIFNGGPADGWEKTGFQQAVNNIFTGGTGDGSDKTVFLQSFNNIFTGGNADGWNITGFAQPVNNIFNGGNGDGWDKTGFAQSISNIFNGGNGDGWDKTGFAQPLNNIFNGGNGDGWDKTVFSQPGNNIFLGGAGDGWSSTYRPMGPLPVNLLSFTATKYKSVSLLNWRTSQEINSSYFDVERSGDAIFFTKIGSVAAAGNSSLPIDYNFTDNAPFKGMNYYRLRQVDINGQFRYTPARLVRFDDTDPLSVSFYPNPTQGMVTIRLSSANSSEARVITISNAAGMVLNQIKISGTAGTMMQLDLSRYAKGVYFIQLRTATLNSTERILVQ